MKPDPEKFDLLLNIVSQTAGFNPRTPTDFVALAGCIYNKTGRTIGLSTLKRLWGYITDQPGTTYSTLSLLSRYAGYRDWDNFCDVTTQLEEDRDSEFTSEEIVESRLLQIGTEVSISLGNGKSCSFRKTAQPDKFEITHARNIKLHTGDSLRVACLAVGRPFYATDCWRDNYALGSYTGARTGGILEIKVES